MKNYNVLKDRILRFEKAAFQNGILKGCHMNKSGHIVISDHQLKGSIESAEMTVEAFTKAVISWNTKTLDGTNIEILAQYKVGQIWSEWFTYGIWSDQNRNIGSVSGQSDNNGKLSTDLVQLNRGKTGSSIRVKAVLKRNEVDQVSPVLRRIVVSTYSDDLLPYHVVSGLQSTIDMDVPELSQMIIPKIGNVICSPTSVTMILNHYGENLSPEKVAFGCLDNGAEIYGNWAYNVAYAGERGYEAFVMGCHSFGELKGYLDTNTPVIASIRTKVAEELTNAPQAYPGGHLIVIRGFNIMNGKPYIIVNDPASKDLNEIKRYYLVEEFEKVWNRIIYIIRPEI